jgi:hypothetical protein
MLSILLALAAQASSSLPPAKALPPPAGDEQAVLATINQMFAGMAAKDGAQILSHARPDGRLTGVRLTPGAPSTIRSQSWSAFAAGFKPGEGPSLEERLVGMPAVEIDSDIAMVWSPYIFLIDGKLSHCGIDHFDMVREQGRWKVLNVTWTRRTTDCPNP